MKADLFGKTLAACAAWLLLAATPCAAEPFEWSTSADGKTLTANLRIAPGFYVSFDTLMLLASGGGGTPLAAASVPEPVETDDGAGGRIRILPAGRWSWSFRGEPPFALSVEFSGCRKGDSGGPPICLPPAELQLLPVPRSAAERQAVKLEGKALDVGVLTSGFQPAKTLLGAVSKEKFLQWLSGGKTLEAEALERSAAPGFLGLLLAALLGGLALNLTPCVLPLIPVNLIIIGAAGRDRKTGFRRGLAYGGGMALAYGAIGAAVVLAGARFGALNSSPLFNFIVAAVFFALAVAMTGLFQLDPGAWFRRRSLPAERGTAGGVWIAAAMGALSALLAGACVAPAVIAVLLLAAARFSAGEAPAILLPFCLGVGMALPWPFAGMGLAVLPRPGKFMVRIKYLLAAAIFCVGIWYCRTGFALLPRRGYSAAAEIAELEAALARGRREKKPVVVDFHASWCGNCREFERSVLSDPEVKKRLAQAVFLRFRAERLNDPGTKELLDAWGIPGLPAVVMLVPDGRF